ncbi:MAG: serine/threonine-protein kinase, partial [Lacipirellulaceae bacterium]
MDDKQSQPKHSAVASASCEACGLALGLLSTSDSLCPSCLLSTAIEELQSDELLALGAPTTHQGAPSSEELSKSIPQFEFLELLGGGGSGWVYLAKQISLNRLVAVKLLRQRVGRLLSTHERFGAEAQTLANLNHSKLVTVHDYGTTENEDSDGTPHCYLVMEYIPGPTLRHKLRSGPLSVRQATRIACQICEAIQYAHSQGIVHRDLKPENILFTSDAENADLKVADFGIAKLIGEGELSTSYTATGTVVGTPYYMAPERHLASSAATRQSDIYSLGVLLYEMLTGQIPIGNFPPLEQSHGIPKPLSDAVHRAVASNPAERFSTAAELDQAIQSPSGVQTAAKESGRLNRSLKRAIVGLLLLTLGIAGGYS